MKAPEGQLRDRVDAWLEERRAAGDFGDRWQECQDGRLMLGVVARLLREYGTESDKPGARRVAGLIAKYCWVHARQAASVVDGAEVSGKPGGHAIDEKTASAILAAGSAAFGALGVEMDMKAREVRGEELERCLHLVATLVVTAAREAARVPHIDHSDALVERAQQLAEDAIDEDIACAVRRVLPESWIGAWLRGERRT
jgi:hypothetical protein